MCLCRATARATSWHQMLDAWPRAFPIRLQPQPGKLAQPNLTGTPGCGGCRSSEGGFVVDRQDSDSREALPCYRTRASQRRPFRLLQVHPNRKIARERVTEGEGCLNGGSCRSGPFCANARGLTTSAHSICCRLRHARKTAKPPHKALLTLITPPLNRWRRAPR